MEKEKKDRASGRKIKASKANLTDIEPVEKPSVTVADDTALVTSLTTNTPFTLAEKYVTICLPHSCYIPIIPLMEALQNNTTVKKLGISPRLFEPKELREFIWCLSSANKGINELTLQAFDFDPNFVEALTKILKLNRQIKSIVITFSSTTQFYDEGFARFCDGMEYYHFEEIQFVWSGISGDLLNNFFESLKYNQSIKSVRFMGDQLISAFPTLCNTLVANPTVTKLHLENTDLKHFNDLKEVLKVNNLKYLSLRGAELTTKVLTPILNELIANTSVEELIIGYGQDNDWKMLGDIFAANKTIKKLNLSEGRIKDRELKHLQLGSNTTLTELDIRNCPHVTDYREVIGQLMDNNTLKKLAIGYSSGSLDAARLSEYIATNTSLTDLDLEISYGRNRDEVLEAVVRGLEVNKTLRKLSMPMQHVRYRIFSDLIEVLKQNNKLVELNITRLSQIPLEKKPPNGSEVDDLILDLLKSNKTLRRITGAEDYPYLEERLKENRETQDKIIQDTCTFINMIVIKPQSFILPVEVWLHVFKYISYSFVPFDFQRFFGSLLK